MKNRDLPVGNSGMLVFILAVSLIILFLAAVRVMGGNSPSIQDKAHFIDMAVGVAALFQFVCVLMLYLSSKKVSSVESKEKPGQIEKCDGKKEQVEVSAVIPPVPAGTPDQLALMLMTLLQEKGRLVDFIMEDITQYSDEQVSSACRVVHQGCREVIMEAFAPVPVSEQEENNSITLEAGYAAREYRIVGNIDRKPPLSGTLLHKGWRAKRVNLPKPAQAVAVSENPVIVPAEVDIK
ncbi:DUF2760 domain-containing protein [Candidatus Riflebacteria bacterium]